MFIPNPHRHDHTASVTMFLLMLSVVMIPALMLGVH